MIGQVLNERYEILEKIGEGGHAATYRGRDRVLGRAVAVKVLKPALAADAEFLARFRREARAAAGIAHEHIATVYDTGSDGARHYIVMEYVPGESLKSRLTREGRLPLDQALRIASETAEALAAAHAAGVIHRDIKPHNILLGPEGQVKVTDFGIARAMSAAGGGDTGVLVGTVHYVSPEQARGEAVGPQSDLYSLGVTLFEMLCGRPPFDGGERLAVLHQHVYDPPPNPATLRPGLPEEVASVVSHCLEKDLSRRFASARELLGYLAACPREERPSRRPGPWRAWWRRRAWAGGGAGWRARRSALVVGAVAIALTALVVGVTLWASARVRTSLVPVPDVVGVSAAAAQQLLGAMGLEYRAVGQRESEEVAPGSVLSQSPSPRSRVARGAVVKVVLSEGPRTVVVPNVSQMSLAQARLNLEAAGLALGSKQEAYHNQVPAGYVTSSYPTAGARVVRGTAVDLVVSLGPKPELPPGPPLPSQPTREEKLDFTVPADIGAGAAKVVVEVVDAAGSRTLYEGEHRAGDHIPAQTIAVSGTTTVRVLVDGQLRAERVFQP